MNTNLFKWVGIIGGGLTGIHIGIDKHHPSRTSSRIVDGCLFGLLFSFVGVYTGPLIPLTFGMHTYMKKCDTFKNSSLKN